MRTCDKDCWFIQWNGSSDFFLLKICHFCDKVEFVLCKQTGLEEYKKWSMVMGKFTSYVPVTGDLYE